MRALRAFLLGMTALGVPVAAGALTAGTVAQAARAELELGFGPVVLVSVARTADGSVTTLGLGVVLAACAGGLLNAAAALVIGRRRRRRPPAGAGDAGAGDAGARAPSPRRLV